jgi:DNA-binding NarL/FixJ family response regulator
MQDDPNLAAAVLDLGTIAFVLKHSAGPELMKAIVHVLRGQPYLTPKSAPWIGSKPKLGQVVSQKEMTPRQRDLFKCWPRDGP